jgi:hypothetical protein
MCVSEADFEPVFHVDVLTSFECVCSDALDVLANRIRAREGHFAHQRVAYHGRAAYLTEPRQDVNHACSDTTSQTTSQPNRIAV